MSNERVVKAAEAVQDLRAALDRWCARIEHEANALDVHTAGHDAVAAVDQALSALHSIRDDTVSEIRRYQDAQGARLDALLGAMEPRTQTVADYRCGDCGQVFPIDPTDPMVAHGNYLDHMEEHERDDLADDERDKAAELSARQSMYATPGVFESPEVPR